MRSVENVECGKCAVWKMWSEGHIATRRYNTQYNSFPSHAPCVDPGKAQYSSSNEYINP